MKTYSQKSSEISREWWIIDASTLPLGKLAVVIADKLMGKSKVTYTPHTDNGDYVVVVNAKNLKVTGEKMTDKELKRSIANIDKGRREYYNFMTMQTFGEKSNYDLCINTANISIKGMVPYLARMLKGSVLVDEPDFTSEPAK